MKIKQECLAFASKIEFSLNRIEWFNIESVRENLREIIHSARNAMCILQPGSDPYKGFEMIVTLASEEIAWFSIPFMIAYKERVQQLCLYFSGKRDWSDELLIKHPCVDAICQEAYKRVERSLGLMPVQNIWLNGWEQRDAVHKATGLLAAAQKVIREKLDEVSVHPCDVNDDSVRAKSLVEPYLSLYNAIKVSI
jgi:hypothetical protein